MISVWESKIMRGQDNNCLRGQDDNCMGRQDNKCMSWQDMRGQENNWMRGQGLNYVRSVSMRANTRLLYICPVIDSMWQSHQYNFLSQLVQTLQ